MTIEEAAEAGVKTVILGVANRGGLVPDSWLVELEKALDLGMDIASGLHTRISTIPSLAAKAPKRPWLYDVRHPTGTFSVETARSAPASVCFRSARTVPSARCSLPSPLSGNCIARCQGDLPGDRPDGIFIAGSGISVDAVVADFISGAVEELAPANDADHWDLVEGQGSCFMPPMRA